MDESTQKEIFALLAVTIIAFAAYSAVYGLPKLSVSGGFQGQAYGVQGLTFGSYGNVPVGNAFPSSLSNSGACGSFFAGSLLGSSFGYSCSWNWGTSSTSSPDLHATASSSLGSLVLDVSYQTAQPVATCQAGNLITPSGASPCPTVSLYVTAPNGTKIHEYGWVVSYALSTAVSASGSASDLSGDPSFQGVTWVNQLASFYWPNAYADPTNSSWQGNVIQVPLQLYVNDCKTGSTGSSGVNTQPCSSQNPPGANQMNPMNAGSQVQLYTNSGLTGSWNQLGCSIAGESSTQCASAVQGSLSPSPYLNRGVSYFPETMQNFGGYSCGGVLGIAAGTCYSFTDLHYTLYTLLIGYYIPNSTSQITQTQSNNGGGQNTCGSGFAALLCELEQFLGLGFLAALGTAAIVILVLVIVGPTVIILASYLLRRPKEEAG